VSDVFLRPGDCYVGHRGQRLHTVLGSCVAITLWHPGSCAGGMCHFMLAHRPGAAAADARYGDDAVQAMLDGLAALGVPARACEAKAFGGGAMFGSHGPFDIGRRNGDAARELLARHGIPLRSHSLYGHGHRRIVFHLASGDVWVRGAAPAHGALCAGARGGSAAGCGQGGAGGEGAG
jgi:chemotaxis protein CheD